MGTKSSSTLSLSRLVITEDVYPHHPKFNKPVKTNSYAKWDEDIMTTVLPITCS